MKRHVFAAIALLVILAGPVMATVTLDFEALAHAGGYPGFVAYSSIDEDGFTLTPSGGSIAITGRTGLIQGVDGGYQGDSYKGSATAWGYEGKAVYLTRQDNGPFDFHTIDLARYSDYRSGDVTVTIWGYNSAGAQVTSQAFTLPAAGDETLHTYTLNNSFKGIYKAGWVQSLDFHQYDNIVVSAVPEPATIGLLAMGGLLIRKRK